MEKVNLAQRFSLFAEHYREAERMEALETRILARLGVPNPYADGTVME